MKRLSNVFVFWSILVFGGLMVTVGYVLLQAPGTKVSFGPDVHLSEADKVYIAQITEQTKWLESLAYASLAGLIILQGKGSGDGLSKITSVGAGLLIVSLYGGFLSRDVILVALTKGTPLLYATLGTWPHVTQFWCLIVGLALLARDFLWTKKTAVAAAGATVLLFGFSSPSRLNAQPPDAHQKASPVPGCARDWAKSRFSNTASNEDSVIMSDFIARAAQRANIPSVALQSRDFAYSTMDKVRYASKAINNGEDTLADTIVLTGSLRDQLKANAAAPGTFFATLINSLDVWHSSTGAISIETDRNAAVVTIVGNRRGSRPCSTLRSPAPTTFASSSAAQSYFKNPLQWWQMSARWLSFLSCVLCTAAVPSLYAQQLPAARIAQVEAEAPPNLSPASHAAIQRYMVDRTKLMIDIVWSTEHLNRPKPHVETQMLNTRVAPYITGTTITYPMNYAVLMDQIGATLGHDLFAEGDRFPVAKPILQQPYAKPYLLQSMDPAIMFYQNDWYQKYRDLIACQSNVVGCQNMQGMTRYALSLFLVAHECGHYIYGDTQEGLDEAQERKADAFAWDVVQKIAAAYHYDDPDVNKKFAEIFGAGAFAFLNFEIQTSKIRILSLNGDPANDAALKILDDRVDALRELAGDDLSGTISNFLPDDPESTRYRSVNLGWTTTPDVLMVNGTLLSVHNEAGKTLLLGSGTLRVIAWSPNGLTIVATSPAAGSSITLDYQPYLNGSREEIEAALKNRDLTTVLRMGTRDGAVRTGAWAAHAVN